MDFYEEVQQKNKKHTKQATRFAILNTTLYVLVMSQVFSSLGKNCIIAFLSNMILFPLPKQKIFHLNFMIQLWVTVDVPISRTIDF